MNQLLAIMQRELRHELRSRRSWLAILLYICSVVYITYLAFQHDLEPVTWNALFWILIIFISMFAASGSFAGRDSEMLYIYTLISPRKFIMARLAYNGIFMLLVSVVAFIAYCMFVGNPVGNVLIFFATLLLAVWGISSLLTMSFAISIKGGGGFALMAIISFPLLVPLLITAQHLSSLSMMPEPANYMGNIAALFSLDALIAALCYLLFPYLWRD
ncbi:MAG: heme exporter protein CcmB [Bacteroidia bacterium]